MRRPCGDSLGQMEKKKKTAKPSLLGFCLFREGFFAGFDQTGEGLGIGDGDLGEHLAVDLDAALLESVHEDGVGDVVGAASGVDTLDPELAIVTLHQTTGIVGVAEGVANLLLSGFEQEVFAAEVAFGHF